MRMLYISAICFLLFAEVSWEQTPDMAFNHPTKNKSVFNNTANLCLKIANQVSDHLHVRFYGRKKSSIDAAPPTTGKFTIILLPDTQYYTAEPQGTRGGNNTMFKREINWIVNNRVKKNIVYVGHLGDCTNNGDTYEVEWKRSDTAIKKLEDPSITGLTEGIPYGVCVGNHDQSPKGSATGTTAFYNKYFGTTRFNGRSYYGGHYGTNNDNFYQLFSVGNFDFLIIYFEFDASTANFTQAGGALDWGENLIKNYPKRNVIVISHYVLKADGTFNSQGLSIYQRFRIYPNFKLMTGGHVPDSAAEAVRLSTYNGNSVYTVLSNYQGRANGGNGLLRIYEFDPANNNVSVKTYSPWLGTYETDSNSQFNMNIKLISHTAALSADTFHLISESNEIASGYNACTLWQSLKENTSYEWYAEISDGKNKITSPTWSFTTNQDFVESNKELSVMIKPKESFTIYPNPNKTNKLTISFDKMIKGKVSVEIFNIMGSLMLQKIFMNVNNYINFEHDLSSGIYTVLVETESGREVKKLVVTK